MLLYLIRHGDPNYQLDCLTDRGKLQAEAVAKRMQASKIDVVYSSPMGRAMETAAPTCKLLDLPCHIEEWTHEVRSERLTTYPDGKPKSVTLLQNTLLRENGEADIPFERAFESKALRESEMASAFSYIRDSGREFLRRLGYEEENGVYRILKQNEDRIALFTHAVFTRTWLSHLLHIPMHLMWASFAPTHTGVTVVEFKNNPDGFTAPKVLCFSDMSHLFAAGLDMTHDNSVENL